MISNKFVFAYAILTCLQFHNNNQSPWHKVKTHYQPIWTTILMPNHVVPHSLRPKLRYSLLFMLQKFFKNKWKSRGHSSAMYLTLGKGASWLHPDSGTYTAETLEQRGCATSGCHLGRANEEPRCSHCRLLRISQLQKVKRIYWKM